MVCESDTTAPLPVTRVAKLEQATGADTIRRERKAQSVDVLDCAD